MTTVHTPDLHTPDLHTPDLRGSRLHSHDPRVTGPDGPAFLYHMEARLTTSVMIGLRPDGIRMDNGFEGHITSGELAGARVEGIDYYLIRPDGVGVIDARETIVGQGYAVGARAVGYVLPPEGMDVPPLERLMDPDFPWPDVSFPLQVAQTFSTGAAALDHLNRLLVAHVGGVNYATRELAIDAYRIAPATFDGPPAGVS